MKNLLIYMLAPVMSFGVLSLARRFSLKTWPPTGEFVSVGLSVMALGQSADLAIRVCLADDDFAFVQADIIAGVCTGAILSIMVVGGACVRAWRS